jgi:hypothetical protein
VRGSPPPFPANDSVREAVLQKRQVSDKGDS